MRYLAAIASESEKNIQFARNQLKLQVEQLREQQDWQRHIQQVHNLDTLLEKGANAGELDEDIYMPFVKFSKIKRGKILKKEVVELVQDQLHERTDMELVAVIRRHPYVKKSEALPQSSTFAYKFESDEKDIPCLAQLCKNMDQIYKISKTSLHPSKMKRIEVSILKSKQAQTKAHTRNPSSVNFPVQAGAPSTPQTKSNQHVLSSMKLQQIVTYRGLQLFQNQRRTIDDYRVYFCKSLANNDKQEKKIRLTGVQDSDGLFALDETSKQIHLRICRIGQLVNTHIFHTYFELTNQMPKSTQPLNCLYIIEKDDD